MKEFKSFELETSIKKFLGFGEGFVFESIFRILRKVNGMFEETGIIDRVKYIGIDQQSEVGELDKIINLLFRINLVIRVSVSFLRFRIDELLGFKRKKRKKKYVGVYRDFSRGKGDNQEYIIDDFMFNILFDFMLYGYFK